MSVLCEPDYVCGWETGLTDEFAPVSTGNAGFTVATPPTLPTGYTSTYALLQGGLGRLERLSTIQGGDRTVRSADFLFYPATNPTGGTAAILSFRTSISGLVGFGVGWDDDLHLKIIEISSGDILATGTATITAASPQWYCIKFAARAGCIDVKAQLYTVSGTTWTLVEEISANTTAYTCGNMAWVSIGAWLQNSSSWYMDNLYLQGTFTLWPPTAPKLAFAQPSAVSSNHVNWKWWDGAAWTDSAANEWPEICERPPDDTDGAGAKDFIRRVTSTAAAIQYYSHALAELTGENILAVQVGFRGENDTSATMYYYCYMQLAGTTKSTYITLNSTAWNQDRVYYIRGKDPSLADWTPANITSTIFAADIRGTGNVYISQIWMYVVHGTDTAAPTAIQRQTSAT